MRKIFITIFTLVSICFSGCNTGQATRIDPGQAPEHRDLTVRDLDELSARLFANIMSRYPREILSGPTAPTLAAFAVPQITGRGSSGFSSTQRMIGLQQAITRSGAARLSANRIVSESQKQNVITFARSQAALGGNVGADFILEQHIIENREYHKRFVVKTYTIILKLVDIRPGSNSFGTDVIADQQSIVKNVRI